VTQFSLFGAAALQPTLVDLDGVLLAGGLWSRRADRARLSVVVDSRWRADGLTVEFELRQVADEVEAVVAAAEAYSVRTSFSTSLAAEAARWARGSLDGPPADLSLTAGGLRLWAMAAGREDEGGFYLAVREGLHFVAGAQLSRLGVAAVALNRRGKPGWRVTGTRRLRRLAELLGPAPPGAGPAWPTPSR
jgi:hypothetical protein